MIDGELSRAAEARYHRLRREWPYDPAIDWGAVEERFCALSAEDQDNCSRMAERYIRRCRQMGRKIMRPARWLAERGWEPFLEAERRFAASTGCKPMVWVREGSRAWDAWREHKRQIGKPMPCADQVRAERGRGWYFPTLFPPSAGPAHGPASARLGR